MEGGRVGILATSYHQLLPENTFFRKTPKHLIPKKEGVMNPLSQKVLKQLFKPAGRSYGVYGVGSWI
jgi:hypothetical protein